MVQAITLAVIINAYLTFSLGILFNFLLYYLAKKHSTNDLKEYFRITVYHICWHLLQIISQTIGQPVNIFKNFIKKNFFKAFLYCFGQ